MGGDKIGPRQAIAVEKHEVVAARFTDRAIADFAGAKAAMLVPDMGERNTEPRLPLLHQRRGGRPRAVVGHEHLEVAIPLARKRTQHGGKRVFAVVRGDDDGDQRFHRRRPFSQAFM